jgi:hypothetical protein
MKFTPTQEIVLALIGVVIGVPVITYFIVEHNNRYIRQGPHTARTFILEEDEPSGGKRKNKSRKLRR